MAAASAMASVASMPCSPATARSRARRTTYAACSASWSTASACSSSTCPNLSARSACASFHATSSRIDRTGAPSGRVARYASRSRANSWISTGNSSVSGSARHLDQHRAPLAQHVQGRVEDLAPPARAGRSGSGGRASRTPRRVSGPDPSPYVSPASTPSSAAASATVRHIGPAQSWLVAMGRMPRPGTRPSVGLRPTRLWLRRRRQDRPVGLGADRHGGQAEGRRRARAAAGPARRRT